MAHHCCRCCSRHWCWQSAVHRHCCHHRRRRHGGRSGCNQPCVGRALVAHAAWGCTNEVRCVVTQSLSLSLAVCTRLLSSLSSGVRGASGCGCGVPLIAAPIVVVVAAPSWSSVIVVEGAQGWRWWRSAPLCSPRCRLVEDATGMSRMTAVAKCPSQPL